MSRVELSESTRRMLKTTMLRWVVGLTIICLFTVYPLGWIINAVALTVIVIRSFYVVPATHVAIVEHMQNPTTELLIDDPNHPDGFRLAPRKLGIRTAGMHWRLPVVTSVVAMLDTRPLEHEWPPIEVRVDSTPMWYTVTTVTRVILPIVDPEPLTDHDDLIGLAVRMNLRIAIASAPRTDGGALESTLRGLLGDELATSGIELVDIRVRNSHWSSDEDQPRV